jgi:uncharacterized protein YceK
MRLAPLLLMITSILISGCASHSVDARWVPATMAAHRGRKNTSRWCSRSKMQSREMRLMMPYAALMERNRDRRPTLSAVARGPGIIRCLSNPMLPRLDQYQNDGA